ncbi:MAG: anti-sigma factor domain-containing protein [Blastocatellia bacterium]
MSTEDINSNTDNGLAIDVMEDAPLYALGALDLVSHRRFEKQYIAGTPAAREFTLEMLEVAALLPHALPPIPVPAYLKQDLLARLATDHVFIGRTHAPATLPVSRRSPSRWLLMAASVALAFSTTLLFFRNRSLNFENNSLAARLRSGSEQLATIRQQWNSMLSPATRVVALSGDAAPRASAKLMWETAGHQWVIYIQNLPAAPTEKEYQLWYLTQDQAKISAAVFRTDAAGQGELRLALPRELTGRLAAVAVSLEPRGGSPQPTGQIYLKGAI